MRDHPYTPKGPDVDGLPADACIELEDYLRRCRGESLIHYHVVRLVNRLLDVVEELWASWLCATGAFSSTLPVRKEGENA